MSARNLKARLISLFAIILTGLFYVTLVQITHAERPERQNSKVSFLLKGRADETVTVIVTLAGPKSGRLNAFLQQNGIHQRREMKSLRSFSLSLPFGMVAELATFPEVLYISSNEVVNTLGHVAQTTGAAAGEAAAATAGRGTINGSGVAIAILDSGIDLNHAQFSATPSRVLASVDLTGENRTDDPYGHGTFVAAAAAGGASAGADYTGIAPGASLVNVRVLDSNGNGTTESVLAGLDWVADHARQYNIRIVNLSL
ncbi:MAG TPA: S8 family serine peptidase, partial [Pyrinomonadaceae bacterium]|nr:S8 family serine peptidase [Pyrinomonadaceae bacterium]